MARKKNTQSSQHFVRGGKSDYYDRENLLNRMTTRIRHSLDLGEILTTTVQEIRSFLGIDRVKIYRFAPDRSGEVIAESIYESRLPSLLGLRFPSRDIPPHALELFLKARQRVIVDVIAGLKIQEQLDSPLTGQSLVTEDIRYYQAEPCHLKYLEIMGVHSSLIVPILHQNRLWGLLACHHSQQRQFAERELQIVQLLVDQLSIAIAQSNLLNRSQQQADREATINKISSLLLSGQPITQIRQTILEKSVKALQGSGGRLYINKAPDGLPAQLFTYGDQPELFCIEETPYWQNLISSTGDAKLTELSVDLKAIEMLQTSTPDLLMSAEAEDYRNKQSSVSKGPILQLCVIPNLYQEPQLNSLASAFQATAIRSILIVPLRYCQQCVGCLTIFRNEIETETLWAGRYHADERNQAPRQSFEAWREIIKGEVKEWEPEELKLAQAVGTHLYMAVMQRRTQEMIRHQASHDHLTGLANRFLFDDRLSLTLAACAIRGEMLAVVFLDLDGFKTINDTLGHATGDQLLQSAARRLTSCLREGDLVARWGGDEFTFLLSPISCAEEAAKIVQKILDTLNIPFHFNNQELYIKASVGIALSPYDGEDTQTLLKNADAAMYRAKQKGRNNYQLYTPAIGSKVLERLVLESRLYKALEREEFLLHYQPQVDITTGQIVGIEALIRWQSAELGLVRPNQFIPLAEETGLICPIGEWVLRRACIQNQIWQSMGLPPLRIAVNLSARQFQQGNLIKAISQILEETALEPHYLELEITESIAMHDVGLTVSVLQKLQSMGIQISMDDFGTGYSSLSFLKQFPLDKLKIDRSFIRDLMTDAKDAAIIKAVIALGQGLNLKVFAEGVETTEQLEFLRNIKCDGIQGYIFSKPLSFEAATQLLQK